jgi:hypothetical protein
MRSISYGLLLVSLTLPIACSDPEPPVQRPSAACEEEGEPCTCPDGTESELECSADESTCSCADHAKSDDDDETSDGAKDDDAVAQTMRDAGKTAPSIDAGKVSVTPKPDAGAPDATSAEPLPPPPDTGKPDPAMLPKPTGTCPDFKEGMVTFKGQRFQIYVGDDGESKLGPLVFYWYATGSSVSEVTRGLSTKIVNDIKAQGGMVAAMVSSVGTGQSTGNFVWFVDDYKWADEVLACAIEKKVGIDTSRIHAIGFSAGGLQSSWMAYARNNYMASVVAYSGGLTGLGEGTWVTPVDMTPDPTNVVPAMLYHGAPGRDVVIMDFAVGSAAMEADIKKRDGFSLDCNHGGGHMIAPNGQDAAWQFMQDHPYKTKPSPYVAGGIPKSFPSYCKVP